MFNAVAEMVEKAEAQGLPLHEVVNRAEMAQSSHPRETLRRRMQQRCQVMRRSAEKGLAEPVLSLSGISGGNAHKLWQWLEGHQPLTGPILSRAIARAMAVNEVNAGMGCIVATPTAGSAGILPGVLLTLQETYHFDDEQMVDACSPPPVSAR
jgi:L-serine dehydratase